MRVRNRYISRLCTFVCGSLVASCTSRAPATDHNSAANNGDEMSFKPAFVPRAGDVSCGEPPQPPTLCDWVNSVDAILVGTVDTLDALTEPIWIQEDTTLCCDRGELKESDECVDGVITPGLRWSVDITEVLRGDVTGDRITIVAGGREQMFWPTNAILDSDGGLAWQGNLDQLPTQPGTTVGFALTWIEERGVWALMGDRPFSFDEGGGLVFGGDGCFFMAPSPAPSDFWALRDQIGSCPSVPHAGRTQARVGSFGQPHRSFAAYCGLLGAHPDPPDMGND